MILKWLLLCVVFPVVSYSMDTAIISEVHSKTESQMREDVYSPHYRFANLSIMSNLRLLEQHTIDFERPPHPQSWQSLVYPCDSMTQVLDFFFPNLSEDYLVANQTRDIIGLTDPLKFYEALTELKRNPSATVWDVFSIMFSRHLLDSAKGYIEKYMIKYNIFEFGNEICRCAEENNFSPLAILEEIEKDCKA